MRAKYGAARCTNVQVSSHISPPGLTFSVQALTQVYIVRRINQEGAPKTVFSRILYGLIHSKVHVSQGYVRQLPSVIQSAFARSRQSLLLKIRSHWAHL